MLGRLVGERTQDKIDDGGKVGRVGEKWAKKGVCP
jgi:hypothetical protein